MDQNRTKCFENGTKCLYPILDVELVLRGMAPPARRSHLRELVRDLAEAGVQILQYRNKHDSDSVVLDDARAIRATAAVARETARVFREAAGVKSKAAASPMRLILNDRVHLFDPNLFDGVHVGQDDLAPNEARKIIGPNLGSGPILGVSTHNDAQVITADHAPVDYIAIGPVFSTSTKSDASPVIGLDGVRRARALTSKPLVAIGGITLANAAQVYAAGADSLAVIAAIFATSNRTPAQSARDFLAVFK